ncbi:MAG: hypothetical protein WAM82_01155 [Thermoanaerobaculia bacterium]
MMILAQQGQSFTMLDQVKLFGLLVPNILTGVATTPDSLAAVLNGQFPDRFRVASATTSADVARYTLWSLMQNVPAAVPAYQDGHWTVVERMDTDATPAPGQPYSISAVWAHNPDDIPVNGVPPHGPKDSCASTITSTYLDYRKWLGLVDQNANPFKLKCVVSTVPINIQIPRAPIPPPPIVPSFNESMAEDALLNTLKLDGLGESKIISRLSPSGQVKAKSLGLVRGLDENIADYYLVSAVDNRGVIGLAEIDAKRPWLRSFGILGIPQEKVTPDRQEILQALLQAQLPVASDSESWWTSQLQSAQLVWRPSNESSSPLAPFLAVPLGSSLEPQRHAFVRFTKDKPVFRELTDPLPGG